MSLNWKVVVAGLAVVGVAGYLINPSPVIGGLPLLLFAACPLAMMFMMKGMGGMQGMSQGQPTAASQQYTCSMHPEVRADQPGRCPKCGWALVAAPAPKQEAVPRAIGAADDPVAGVSREAELALMQAQLRVLREHQAALAGRIEEVEEAEAKSSSPGKALEEAERVAQAAANRS